MSNTTIELSGFTLRARFETSVDDVFFTFQGSADQLLDDIDGIGEVKAYIRRVGAEANEYATMNDGEDDIELNGVPCYLESTNGSYIYYPVRGGLANGDYRAVIEFKRKNGSGKWDPKLKTNVLHIRIDDLEITSF